MASWRSLQARAARRPGGPMPTAPRPSRFRLPADVRPTGYDLLLEPDLEGGRFRGEVRIALRLARPRAEIVLHAAELAIEHASAHAGGREAPARVRLSRADETAALRFARPLAAGEATLALHFSGRLNQHLRGLYAAGADGSRYAFSQCEAADARRILPCFDEPAFKARFRVAVRVREGETAVSNGPVEHEERVPGGRILRFAETPPLSTYLLALAVGRLEASAPRHLGPVPIRVWHVPGKGQLTAFALEAAAAALARLQDYFDIPYPYRKLDLVAVPDFEAGAMENAGAVFFRETLLLLDPATASLAERKRAAEVIAHELAHMWFGDLVTLAWWDDLWLNEAFASWLGDKVVQAWRPAWDEGVRPVTRRAGALDADALQTARRLRQPIQSTHDIENAFDRI